MKKIYFVFTLTLFTTICLNAQYTGGSGSGYDMGSTGQIYALSFEIEGEGSVTVKVGGDVVDPEPAGSDTYLLEEGTEATISAKSDAEWAFGYWEGEAVPEGNEEETEITIIIDEAVSIKAKYRKELTITVNDGSRIYGETEGDYSFQDFSDQLITGDVMAEVTGGEGEADDVEYTFEITNINSNTGVYLDEIGIDPESLTGDKADDYHIVDIIKGELTINERELTVTADNKDKEYDGETFGEEGYTVSYDGFAAGDNEDDLGGVLSFSGEAITAVDVGIYGIIPEGLSSDNYDINFVAGELEITPASLTVSADNKQKEYDGEPFGEEGFTVSYVGFAEGEDEENLEGELIFTGNAVGATDAGTWTITPEGLTSDNYNISFESGELEITKKDLIIAASDVFKTEDHEYVFDEDYPSDDFSVSELVEGDAVTSVALESDGAAEGAEMGEYDIVISNALGDGLDNYEIHFENATLTVTEKHLLTLPDVVVENKVYDGNVEAVVAEWGELAGIEEGLEDVSLNHSVAEAEFENKDAGENIDIIINGLELDGEDASHYLLITPSPVADISERELTITAESDSKIYDGLPLINADYSITDGTLADGHSLDDVTVTGSQTDVGSGENVPSNAVITDAGDQDVTANYDITYVSGQLTVNERTLTVINAEAQDKVYDGSDLAYIINAQIEGLVDEEEDVELENHEAGEFVQVTVGDNISVTTPTMTITGADAGNYELEHPDYLEANITTRELTIAGDFTANNRPYDGTTEASVNEDNLELVDVIGEDNVELNNVIVEFADANAGEDITVSITNADITGGAAYNYTLSLENAPTTTARITQKDLTIDGSFTVYDKGYDGTSNADIKDNNLELTGVLENDDAYLDDAIANFADAGPGTNIEVNITGASISGGDKDNYDIDLTGAPVTFADIHIPTVTLELSIDGNGSIKINDSEYFSEYITLYKDSTYTVEAVGDTGWEFNEWEGEVDNENEAVTKILMDDDKELTVNFIMSEYRINIIVDGEGSVDKDPDKHYYYYNDVVTLTAIPQEGWLFEGWSGDLVGNISTATLLVDGDKEITATFTEQATLTLDDKGEGSVIVKKDNIELEGNDSIYIVPVNSELTLEAIADENWMFGSWEGPDAEDLESTVHSITTIIMDRDKSITAVFEDLSNVIELADIGNIKLYPNPARSTINLELESRENLLVVDIINSYGKVVISKSVDSGSGGLTKTFDLTNLEKGTYYIRLITTKGSISKGFIIQ